MYSQKAQGEQTKAHLCTSPLFDIHFWLLLRIPFSQAVGRWNQWLVAQGFLRIYFWMNCTNQLLFITNYTLLYEQKNKFPHWVSQSFGQWVVLERNIQRTWLWTIKFGAPSKQTLDFFSGLLFAFYQFILFHLCGMALVWFGGAAAPITSTTLLCDMKVQYIIFIKGQTYRGRITLAVLMRNTIYTFFSFYLSYAFLSSFALMKSHFPSLVWVIKLLQNCALFLKLYSFLD